MSPNSTTRTKKCSKCGEIKPSTSEYFSRDTHRPDGFQAHCKACRSAYYEANKERIAAHRRAYYEANKEKWRARHEANKERRREYRRAYYEATREQRRIYLEANKERIARQSREWIKANRELARASVTRRRARLRQAEGTHTAEDIQAQYERQKGKCYYCKAKVGKSYHVDHVVPLARGGSNWPENIVIACPTCNRSKHDKMPHEWAQGGRLL